MALLAEQRVAYTSFDILTDSEVRQGLKEFSQWPTYPQLWIDGELVGGLDIVKELIESNEFQAMLPKAAGSKDDGSSGDDLNSRLLRLINRSDLMVFIKGTPDAPQCGFSRQLVDLLNDLQAKFDYFNILSDEQVRQGLKEFSQWPTYPQVYHKGELLGGLDICKEMIEAGEFQQLISE